MNTAIGTVTIGELILYTILILLPTLLVIFSIYQLMTFHKIKRATQNEIIQQYTSSNNKLLSLNHTLGLPLPENTLCKICVFPERYEIKADNQSFYLSRDKVTDVNLKTAAEVQNSYLASAGSYYKSYGPLGELINERTGDSMASVDISYLIFTYMKENTMDYIAFNTTAILEALQLVEEYHTSHDRIRKELYL
ncbi:hypothetical protein R2R35_18885 [Anaerocolumna sp. AGMB13020]|uniref:hypothetical protein n=1 Tax=Anaerocolumna sp. AGMB13020 TaxID=3081750 RepID=UPI0029558B3F|nr:hypothetical protein [Anaerocolumna sp. AGMB13020]WOO35843.1 hypothetical protein R2R35_18885 [Anaerocolumna sp. AGMB13020]